MTAAFRLREKVVKKHHCLSKWLHPDCLSGCMQGCGANCVCLCAAFASRHKGLWHSGINQVAGMTGGWGNFSLIRHVETPYVLILSCSYSTCLLVWACLVGRQRIASQCHTLIHDTHIHSQHTHKGIWTVFRGKLASSNLHALNLLDPHWFSPRFSFIRQLLQM